MDIDAAQDALREYSFERALKDGFVSSDLVASRAGTERELRIKGWAEDRAAGGWKPFDQVIHEPIAPQPGTDLAVQDDARRALELTHGQRYLEVPGLATRYASGPGRHHRPAYDDYEIAKACIVQALGDMTDIEVWRTDVLCAVFCRPNISPGGIHLPVKEIKEDWWQHKAVLIIKMGPDAFQGDESYMRATFGDKPAPKPGDWVFARPESGMQSNMAGTGSSRPQGRDANGRLIDLFDWDGWPCRFIDHDDLKGRLTNPQAIV